MNLKRAMKTWRGLCCCGGTGGMVLLLAVGSVQAATGDAASESFHISPQFLWSLILSLTVLGVVIGALSIFLYYRCHTRFVSQKSEQQLLERNVYLESVIRAAPTGIILLVDRVIQQVNQQFCEIVGYCESELLGRNLRMLYEEDEEFERVGDEIYSQIREKGTGTLEVTVTRKDGRQAELLVKGTPLDMADWSKGVAFTVLDITERKDKERQLQEKQAYLSSVLNTAPAGIIVLSDRIIRDMNDQYCEMFGYTREELIGQSIRMLYPDDQEYERVGQLFYPQINQLGRGTVEARMITRQGRHLDIFGTGMPIDPDDLSKGMTFAVSDITERKQAVRRLNQRLKLEHLLADISSGFVGLPVERISDQIRESLEMVGKRLGFERLRLCLLSDDKTYFYLSDLYYRSDDRALFTSDNLDRELPEYAEMIRRHQVVWLANLPDDLPEDSALRAFCIERGIVSHVTIPMAAGEQNLGAVAITHTRHRFQLDQELLSYLRLIADILANAIMRQRGQRALAESERRFRNVIEASPMGFNLYSLQPDGWLVLSATNPAAEAILKQPLSESVGQTIEAVFPELAQTDRPDLYRRIAREGGACQINNFDSPEIQRRGGGFHDFHVFQTRPGQVAVMFTDVSEKIKNQRSLEFFRYAMDHAGEAVYWGQKDTRLIYVNETACQMLGYTRDELQQLTVMDLDPSVTKEKLQQMWDETKDLERVQIETMHQCKGGQMIPVEINSSFIEYDGREYIFCFVRDITERKRAQEAIRASEYKHRMLFTTATDAILIMDDMQCIDCNPRAVELFGCCDASEIIGKTLAAFSPVHQEDGQRSDTKWSELVSQARAGAVQRFSWLHCRAGGEPLYVETSLNCLELKGRVLIQAIIRDVTEQMRIRRSLEFTQYSMDHAIEGAIWIADDARPVYVNEAACQELGYTQQELLTMKVHDFDPNFPPEGWDAVWAKLKERGHWRFETLHKTRHGRLIPVEVTANFVEYEGHEYICTYSRDITEQKQAQETIRESEYKHRLLFTTANDAIIIMDETHFLECNPRAVELFGCETVDQLLQHSPVEFSPAYQEDGQSSEQRVKEVVQNALDGYVQRFPWIHRKLNGTQFYAEVTLSPLELEGQRLVQAFIWDVTEQRVAEKAREKLLGELRAKNEELESIVFIASHDLRSPLVNIRGFAGELEKSLEHLKELLGDQTLSDDVRKELQYLFETDIPESLNFIISGNKKMDVLLNGLLKLSRIGAAQVKTTHLPMSRMLHSIVEGFSFVIQEEQMHITIDSAIPDCYGDKTLVNQVFTNLLDNAIKYRHPDRTARIHVSAESGGGWVTYCVADNGVGIAQDHINKVFEIFHQLAPDAGVPGEGLGLTIVRRILTRLNGRIWVESEIDVGTKVFVRLPGT